MIKLDLFTCPGSVRSTNEDSFFINEFCSDESPDQIKQSSEYSEPCFFGVFDGMGGTQSGEIASHIAANISRVFPRLYDSSCDLIDDINKYYQYINQKLIDYQRENSIDFGTTACVVIAADECLYVTNIGDSMAFLVADGKVKLLSVIDNQSQLLVDMKLITREEAKTHAMSSMLTQYLGMGLNEDDGFPEPHIFRLDKYINSKIVVCSDGVGNYLSDDEIISAVNTNGVNAAEILVNTALKNGSKDNVTAIVAEIL